MIREEVFCPTRAPINVRVTARLRRLPLLCGSAWWNHACDWLARNGPLPSRGAFGYRRAGELLHIPFDGRNGQFEAIHDPLYFLGYEPETSALLTRLNRGPGVFWDVGANWGYFSLLVAAAPGFTGEIHAFEPNPASRADLCATIAAARLQDVIHPHATALSDRNGESRLHDGGRFRTGLARITAETGGKRVETRRLDDLGLPAPSSLKIDVEGAEASVLRGALRTLGSARPYVVIESMLDRDHHETTLEPLLLLESAGYRLFVPALGLKWKETTLLTSYWTHIPALLAGQRDAAVQLMPMRASERFLFGHHLNILGCASERIGELGTLPGIEFARAP